MLFLLPPMVTFTSRLRVLGSDSTLITFLLADVSSSACVIDALKLPNGTAGETSVTKLCSPYFVRGFDGVINLVSMLGGVKEESGTKESTRVGFHIFSKLPDRFLTRAIASKGKMKCRIKFIICY